MTPRKGHDAGAFATRGDAWLSYSARGERCMGAKDPPGWKGIARWSAPWTVSAPFPR